MWGYCRKAFWLDWTKYVPDPAALTFLLDLLGLSCDVLSSDEFPRRRYGELGTAMLAVEL